LPEEERRSLHPRRLQEEGDAGGSGVVRRHGPTRTPRSPAASRASRGHEDRLPRPSTASTTIFDSGKLQLTASCNGAGTLSVTATTTVDNATVHSYGYGSDFNTNDFDVAAPLVITPSSDEERDFVYTEPGGQTVIIQYQAASAVPLGGTVACLVTGIALVQ
jgi:hypothetical protein